MQRIINDKNDDWCDDVEAYAAECSVVCICREEVLQALSQMKVG